jgi:hypothetical protein
MKNYMKMKQKRKKKKQKKTITNNLTRVGFEPTPFRTTALTWRLRPLGHRINLTVHPIHPCCSLHTHSLSHTYTLAHSFTPITLTHSISHTYTPITHSLPSLTHSLPSLIHSHHSSHTTTYSSHSIDLHKVNQASRKWISILHSYTPETIIDACRHGWMCAWMCVWMSVW